MDTGTELFLGDLLTYRTAALKASDIYPNECVTLNSKHVLPRPQRKPRCDHVTGDLLTSRDRGVFLPTTTRE